MCNIRSFVKRVNVDKFKPIVNAQHDISVNTFDLTQVITDAHNETGDGRPRPASRVLPTIQWTYKLNYMYYYFTKYLNLMNTILSLDNLDGYSTLVTRTKLVSPPSPHRFRSQNTSIIEKYTSVFNVKMLMSESHQYLINIIWTG